MSKSLYSGVNKVYIRSYLLLNIVASSAYMSDIAQNHKQTVSTNLQYKHKQESILK